MSHPSRAQSALQVEGEYIVKFRPRLAGNAVHSKISNANFNLKGGLPFQGMYSVNVRSGDPNALARLQNDPDVEYIEPNFILSKATEENPGVLVQNLSWQNMVSAHTQSSQFQALDVNGQSYGIYDQSGAAVQATSAWSQSSAYAANNRPVVAVVDSGVYRPHYIFTQTSAIWVNTGEIANNGIDDDFNGFVDDVNGWNFVSNNNNPNDDESHGTHVAGIILGATMDILNTPPLTQTSKILIMPVKFLNSSGSGTTSAAINSIYYAVNNGAKVINCSWGGGSYSRSLHDALTYAYNHGVLVVTAAGNYHSNNDAVEMYPANYDVPSNISVAASSDSDSLASFSNYGANRVHVASPGVSIYSSIPSNSFGVMSGTSMAAPFVAGAAALAWREAPQLSGYQIKSMIISTANTKAALSGKVSSQSRINANGLILEAKSQTSTQNSQPSYSPSYRAERSTASSGSSSSQGGGGGCGLISAIGAGGGAGPMSGESIAVILGIMMLPLAAWLYYRREVSSNHRKYDRFKMTSEIKVKVGERELTGQINTIGVGGLGFNIDEALDRGGIVSMRVSSPDGREMLEVQGRIVWNENNKSYGVQFSEARDNVKSQIESWSQKLVKDS